MDTMTQELTKIKVNHDLDEPSSWKVIYFDDDHTSFSFVAESLVHVFNYTEPYAKSKTNEIHDKGESVVAELPFEIAEQKSHQVLQEAKMRGFPLEIKIQP